MIVTCPCCLRREERTARGTTVIQAGARRPADPAREAWSVVSRSLAGELGPVVGPCPTCGQPLVGEAGADPGAVEIALGEITLAVGADGTLRGPAGVLTVAEADALVEAAAPHHTKPRLLELFQVSLLSFLVVPLVMWTLAIMVVVAFLARANLAF